MREIQSITQSNSDCSFNSETGDFAEADGWETELEPLRTKEFNLNIIKLANKKVSLINIFNSIKLNFETTYSSNGWTHKSRCPFKDHSDESPSFGYNTIDNRFNCFGCKRSGGPVQFLSFYTGKNQVAVAEKLLSKYSDIEQAYIEVQDEYDDKVDNLICEFSNYFQSFLKKNINNANAIKYAENLCWTLDIYIENKTKNKLIVESENLEARISILKRKLESYL